MTSLHVAPSEVVATATGTCDGPPMQLTALHEVKKSSSANANTEQAQAPETQPTENEEETGLIEEEEDAAKKESPEERPAQTADGETTVEGTTRSDAADRQIQGLEGLQFVPEAEKLSAEDIRVPSEGQEAGEANNANAGFPQIADSEPALQSNITPPMWVNMEDPEALIAYSQPRDAQNVNAEQLPLYSLSGLPGNAMSMAEEMDQIPSPDHRPVLQTRIKAYAKLEFDDGQFYMNTYSMVLGRDMAAARAAMRREAEAKKRLLEADFSLRLPGTPAQTKRDESHYSKSVISESGGILRDGEDSDLEERARRRRNRKTSKRSKSTGSSSQYLSRRSSLINPNGLVIYQPQAQIRCITPDVGGARPVDPASLTPSPDDCPLVGIHPPATTDASAYKSISRQHVKLAYNLRKSIFEAEVIGRNGIFVDDVFYHEKEIVPLRSGSQLQIGGVVLRFVLPDVAIGETGGEHVSESDESVPEERYSEGGKEMSFEFENASRDGVHLRETSEEPSDSEEDEEEDQEMEDDEMFRVKEEAEAEVEDVDADDEGMENSERSRGEVDDEEMDRPNDDHNIVSQKSDKKRRPGRPPKDGIMSKREQRLAKKEALQQEKAKAKEADKGKEKEKPTETGDAEASKGPQPPPNGKNKVGRPRKHPRPETPPIKVAKRKYKQRKPKEPKDPNKQDGSGDDSKSKEKKDKKPPKPPRSPSPAWNEADLTPEQLMKPNLNYVQLIYHAIEHSPTGLMSLPQIYRSIQRSHPWYLLKTPTNGWQSSVRHNLSQNEAFKKVEKDGKGWLWAIVPGVSIEKEKKRRLSPLQIPGHMHPQPIYQAGPPPPMMPGHPPYSMMVPPQYPMNPQMHHHPGQSPYMAQPHQINGHPGQPGPHLHINGQPPPGYVASIQSQLVPSNYSSPYAAPPPPQPQPQNLQPATETIPSVLPQSPAPAQQPRQNSPAPSPPQHNEQIYRAIESFKTNLIPSLKEKTSNAEAVVASAVNRVLGTDQSSAQPNPQEEMIINALRTMLSQIPGSTIRSFVPTSNGPRTANQQLSQLQTDNDAAQSTNLPPSARPSGSDKPAPIVMRPSFTGQGQGRPNGHSVPRPPMMIPGMSRTNSGSPANAPPRLSTTPASPALPATVIDSAATPITPAIITTIATPATAAIVSNNSIGANTPQLTLNENRQLAGQKRPHDDSEDMREFKRVSTSGPPPLKT
ncbi:hypothetical protein B7494_g179 [Chlorociboria aeruginascens]|nr:hypothetical protein B7494_g179 [Chlorociboria aeruginascens]